MDVVTQAWHHGPSLAGRPVQGLLQAVASVRDQLRHRSDRICVVRSGVCATPFSSRSRGAPRFSRQTQRDSPKHAQTRDKFETHLAKSSETTTPCASCLMATPTRGEARACVCAPPLPTKSRTKATPRVVRGDRPHRDRTRNLRPAPLPQHFGTVLNQPIPGDDTTPCSPRSVRRH